MAYILQPLSEVLDFEKYLWRPSYNNLFSIVDLKVRSLKFCNQQPIISVTSKYQPGLVKLPSAYARRLETRRLYSWISIAVVSVQSHSIIYARFLKLVLSSSLTFHIDPLAKLNDKQKQPNNRSSSNFWISFIPPYYRLIPL